MQVGVCASREGRGSHASLATKAAGLALLCLVLSVVLGAAAPPTPAFAAGTSHYVSAAGSDVTGDGSSSRPWATIQKAADTMSGGDIVHVASGTYSPFTVSKSGTAGGYTQFVADGAVVVSGGTNGITIQADYVKVDGFRITGYSQHGIYNWGRSYTWVQGCEMSNDVGTAPSTNAAVYLCQGVGHVVDSCNIHSLNAGGVHVMDCSTVTVSDNHVYNLEEDAVLVQGANITVEGNLVHDLDNIAVHSDGIVVQSPWHKTYGANTSNIVIRDNTLYDCTQHIYIDSWGNSDTNVAGVTIANNVLYVTDRSFYQTGVNFDKSRGNVSNVRIYNNTFSGFETSGNGLRVTPRVNSATYSDFHVKNNLFSGSALAIELAVTNLVLDHNLYYRPTQNIIYFLGTYYSSLSAFKAAVGSETNGVSGNPVLTSAYSPGPGSAAAAAGVGPSSDGNVPTTDKARVPRSGPTSSIGAYEYVGSPPPKATPSLGLPPEKGRWLLDSARGQGSTAGWPVALGRPCPREC